MLVGRDRTKPGILTEPYLARGAVGKSPKQGIEISVLVLTHKEQAYALG